MYKSFHLWIAVADNTLRNIEGVNIFRSNLSVAPSKLNSLKRVPVFYKELIDVWKTLSDGALKIVQFIFSQVLWNNKSVTYTNNKLYSEALYCKEIKYVSDLCISEFQA